MTGQDQQALLAQLAAAREKLDGLVRDLRAIEGELEALATEREQHRLLDSACDALQQLIQIGGAGLFWGEPAAAGNLEDHLRRVQGRIDGFQKLLSEIEDRRHAVLDEIERQQGDTDVLQDDVLEAQEEEERRAQEWILQREISVPARQLLLPWTHGGEDDQRFRQSLARSLVSGLLFALVIRQIDLPLRPPEEVVEVPERVVRMMMQARPLPPSTPREEPEPQLAQQKPSEETAPAQAARPEKEGPGLGPQTGPGKGLLAFRERFSGIAELQPTARLGSQARITGSGTAASGQPERSLVTSQAAGSSGGVNLASLSRDVGDGGGGRSFDSVHIARATSTIGGGGGHSVSGSGSRTGPPLGRTDEEIQIVFDRHKAALYRLYNRELRGDPTLKGQMVLRIRIEPDGSVSVCELHATDMKAPQLSAEVVERVRTFDFGAKNVPAITILYPIDFLPAT
jgi:hypothetical protein